MTEDIAREKAKLFLGHVERARLMTMDDAVVETLMSMFMAAYHEGALDAYNRALHVMRGEKTTPLRAV